jgi:hypothetical protein
MNEFDLRGFALDCLPDEGDYGWILETDCYTPDEIHDELKELPICVSKRSVTFNEYSPE